MKYFVNISYTIHVDFKNMQLILCIQYFFIIIWYMYFILNTITVLNFVYNIIMICIRNKNWLSLNSLECLFLLHLLLEMYTTFFITDTYRHVWTMVRVDIMTLWFVTCYFQYQFVFVFIKLRYSYLTKTSPGLLTYLYMVWSSCSPYGSDR